MDERKLVVDLFVEDVAHERFVSALARRVANEEGKAVHVRTGSAKGGHGRVLDELDLYQRARRSEARPDILVVAVDANCTRWSGARRGLVERVDASSFPNHVVACPDPHIERWYLSDPPSLHRALGMRTTRRRRKCERNIYKRQLADGLKAAGHPVVLGGAEFAQEIVEGMDLFRASRSEPSLKHFLEDLRAAIRRFSTR